VKGQLQKRTDSSALACYSCRWFKDDDPDIFYCELQREEFPGLCDEYQKVGEWADVRTKWTANDDPPAIPKR